MAPKKVPNACRARGTFNGTLYGTISGVPKVEPQMALKWVPCNGTLWNPNMGAIWGSMLGTPEMVPFRVP